MKATLFGLLVIFNASAFAAPRVLLDCVEAFSGQLPRLTVQRENNKLTATLTARLMDDRVVTQVYSIKDISGIADTRYIDDTSGDKFLLSGGKEGALLLLSVQAMTTDFEVVQATLHCTRK